MVTALYRLAAIRSVSVITALCRKKSDDRSPRCSENGNKMPVRKVTTSAGQDVVKMRKTCRTGK